MTSITHEKMWLMDEFMEMYMRTRVKEQVQETDHPRTPARMVHTINKKYKNQDRVREFRVTDNVCMKGKGKLGTLLCHKHPFARVHKGTGRKRCGR